MLEGGREDSPQERGGRDARAVKLGGGGMHTDCICTTQLFTKYKLSRQYVNIGSKYDSF